MKIFVNRFFLPKGAGLEKVSSFGRGHFLRNVARAINFFKNRIRKNPWSTGVGGAVLAGGADATVVVPLPNDVVEDGLLLRGRGFIFVEWPLYLSPSRRKEVLHLPG